MSKMVLTKNNTTKFGSESQSYGTFDTRLGGILCGVGLTLGVNLDEDYGRSCNGDGWSLDP